jgi:peptide-methionine (R)-S-oxide reductase
MSRCNGLVVRRPGLRRLGGKGGLAVERTPRLQYIIVLAESVPTMMLKTRISIEMNRRMILYSSSACAGLAVLGFRLTRHADAAAQAAPAEHYTVVHTDVEWRQILSPAAYDVLRDAGTEPPFTSPLLNEERAGTFDCAGCALPLYSSATKYNSGTGWPSFWDHLPHAVETSDDNSFDMDRTEVHCSRCGGHLGHVFPDGPRPTGLRYCMNGVALTFTPRTI